MSKRRNRVTVLCFHADGTRSKYHFNSKPDYDRVRDEAKRDGVMVALVFDRKSLKEFVAVSRQTWKWRDIGYVGDTIRDIQFIFGTSKVKTEPKAEPVPEAAPEHYAGEAFTGPRSEWCAEMYPENEYRFEFTGECRPITDSDATQCYLCKGENSAFRCGRTGMAFPVWILRAVPCETKPADEHATAHQKGEPCNLPVNSVFAKRARGFRFEYAGECGAISGRWYVNRTGTKIVFGEYGGSGQTRELLIAVPDVDQAPKDCSLPVHREYKARAQGLRFFYTAKRGNPRGKWYVAKGGNKIMFGDKPTKRPITRRILTVF